MPEKANPSDSSLSDNVKVSSRTESAVSTKPDATTQTTSSAITPVEHSVTQAIVTDPVKSTGLPPESIKATVISQPVLTFTPEQEDHIGEVAKDYFLAHPEILLDISRKLQEQQRDEQTKAVAAAVLEQQDALLNDKSTPSYGPTDAKVALIEFFDYQCSACAREAPVLHTIMKANPQVRYVFKEWPIYSARWESSVIAAETGLKIWAQKGADAYLTYHDALFATGHREGRLTPQDIRKASATAGKLRGIKGEVEDTLVQTDVLAQNLGFQATPGLIVMPVLGASADNMTVIPGGASQETLQAAIDKASE